MTDLVTVNEATARRAVFDYASTAAEAWTAELERFGALWRKFNADHFGGALDERDPERRPAARQDNQQS